MVGSNSVKRLTIYRASAVVWVLFEIARNPDRIHALREEFQNCVTYDNFSKQYMIDYGTLQSATLLDSFIREVLRTKGDTLSTIRMTTRDVTIGNLIIPKGWLA